MTNTHPSQILGSRFHGGKFCAAFSAIGLALLGASQVQAGPSANGAVHAVTGMEHANYHATKNCGDGVTAMTPQSGTDLMPIDESNVPPEVDTLYRRAARQHVTWISTVECGKTNITHRKDPNTPDSISDASYSVNYSSNWSGWEIGGGAATPNHYVQSGWYEPTVTFPSYSTLNGTYYSSVWAGLGGDPYKSSNFGYSHPLIQAGTAQHINSSGQAHYFWYEVYPLQFEQPLITSPAMPASPGDDVAVGVAWIPASNAAVMSFCNWNTNLCVALNVTSVYVQNLGYYMNIGEPSNTTDWIVEAPTVNGAQTSPPAFASSIYFYNARWSATTTYSLVNPSANNVPGPIGGPASGTGTVTSYQTIDAGPSLTAIGLKLPPPYATTAPLILSPSALSPSQYGGSDFYVYNYSYQP
jgi:hypothetical protein